MIDSHNNKDTVDIIEGRNAVLEALKSDFEINKLFVQRGEFTGSLKKILAIAGEKGILVKETERSYLDNISLTRAHQGVIAMISPVKYVQIEDILNKAKTLGQPPFIVILDEICDPNNLGSILRTAEAVGVHGIVISKHNAVGVTSTVAKVSAGAYLHVPVCRAVNINNTIGVLKDNGLWIAGTDLTGAVPFHKSDLKGPLAVVIGSEEKGMSPKTTKNCDFIINIPMSGKISSLNAGVAAGIILYEAFRQRNT